MSEIVDVDTSDRRTQKPLTAYGVDRWRYQCPKCGYHTIMVRTRKGSASMHKEVELSMRQQESSHVHNFRCDDCGHVFDRPYDKKHGEVHYLDVR